MKIDAFLSILPLLSPFFLLLYLCWGRHQLVKRYFLRILKVGSADHVRMKQKKKVEKQRGKHDQIKIYLLLLALYSLLSYAIYDIVKNEREFFGDY